MSRITLKHLIQGEGGTKELLMDSLMWTRILFQLSRRWGRKVEVKNLVQSIKRAGCCWQRWWKEEAPWTEPCGTLAAMGEEWNLKDPSWNNWMQSERYDWNQQEVCGWCLWMIINKEICCRRWYRRLNSDQGGWRCANQNLTYISLYSTNLQRNT